MDEESRFSNRPIYTETDSAITPGAAFPGNCAGASDSTGFRAAGATVEDSLTSATLRLASAHALKLRILGRKMSGQTGAPRVRRCHPGRSCHGGIRLFGLTRRHSAQLPRIATELRRGGARMQRVKQDDGRAEITMRELSRRGGGPAQLGDCPTGRVTTCPSGSARASLQTSIRR